VSAWQPILTRISSPIAVLALYACELMILRDLWVTSVVLLRMGVNMEQETITVLSPAPGPLPRKTLLFSEVKFVDIR